MTKQEEAADKKISEAKEASSVSLMGKYFKSKNNLYIISDVSGDYVTGIPTTGGEQKVFNKSEVETSVVWRSYPYKNHG